MYEDQGYILVVDDNEMNRDMLSRRLGRLGHHTAVVEDGIHALELMQQEAFDLVLLDIMMPNMTGYEVLERVKSDPNLWHIPVIMISAVDDLESVVKCIELGAEDYLFKPFNPVILKARVNASLEKTHLQQQSQQTSGSFGADEKCEFVSFITHDLKTPLSSIISSADFLISGDFGDINEQQADFLDRIAVNTSRMLKFLDDINDTAQIDADRLHLSIAPVLMGELIDEVIKNFQYRIVEKSLTLNLWIPAELPKVQADRKRLLQVLGILVDNAIQYTPENGQITISAERTTREDLNAISEVLQVTVQDSGIGVRPDDLSKLFEPYFRSSEQPVSDAHQGSGPGLSLYIAKNLIEMQQGNIGVESEPGRGTTFRFMIPIAA